MAALVWTLICLPGLVIWAGIAFSSLNTWQEFRREDLALAHAYFRQLLGDATIFTVLGFWTVIGAVAIVAPKLSGIGQVVVLLGLYAGPLGLTLLGIWRYLRRGRPR